MMSTYTNLLQEESKELILYIFKVNLGLFKLKD